MQKFKETINADDPMQEFDIKVIALSNAGGDNIKYKCEELGMIYLKKPVFELKRVL